MSDKIFEISKLKVDKNQDIKNSPDQSENEPD